jgi:hypothetical protein
MACVALIVAVIGCCIVAYRPMLLVSWVVWFAMVMASAMVENERNLKYYLPLLVAPLLIVISPSIYIRIPILVLSTIYMAEVVDKVDHRAISLVYTGLVIISVVAESSD